MAWCRDVDLDLVHLVLNQGREPVEVARKVCRMRSRWATRLKRPQRVRAHVAARAGEVAVSKALASLLRVQMDSAHEVHALLGTAARRSRCDVFARES